MRTGKSLFFSDPRVDELVEKLSSKPGLRARIDAFCVECKFNPDVAIPWRVQVEGCPIAGCPLHNVRLKNRNKKS